jgi:hypothetical protein
MLISSLKKFLKNVDFIPEKVKKNIDFIPEKVKKKC